MLFLNQELEDKSGETLMSSKHGIGLIILACFYVLLMPRISHGAEWDFSPYRAQIADAQTETTSMESEAMPVDGPQKKNVGKGVMFSLVIPGAGQLYGGSWLTAIPWFAIEVAGWAMFASYHGQGTDKTDEFEAYAGNREGPNNFNHRAYMWREYWVAQDSSRNGLRPEFNGTFDEWLALPWTSNGNDDRYRHLPAPFTHDVLTDDEQQFYEMIGKYLLQFGWGWRDTYSGGAGGVPNDTSAWASTLGGIRADNPATTAFDGDSPMFFAYRDMRADANDLLEKGNIAMEVVLANHVLSALHAAFLIRGQNRRIEQASTPTLGDVRLRYDAKPIAGSMTRFLSVTFPLN